MNVPRIIVVLIASGLVGCRTVGTGAVDYVRPVTVEESTVRTRDNIEELERRLTELRRNNRTAIEYADTVVAAVGRLDGTLETTIAKMEALISYLRWSTDYIHSLEEALK